MVSVSVVVVPEDTFNESQPMESVAVHTKVPCPEFCRARLWLAGLAPPSVAEKEREEGLWLMAGFAGGGGAALARVRVTGIVVGLFAAIGSDRVTVP